ncbi:MAG: hypothetical protein K8H84_13955 [Sulfuricella denitrificans]|nr:hypothetical protein [Sulfuricella denitrificans]
MYSYRIVILALLSMASFTASATPITFTYYTDGAQGSIGGVPFGGGATLSIVLTGDTGSAAACTLRAVAATCIPATGGTVSVNGGVAQAITNLTNLKIGAVSSGQWVGVVNTVDVNTYTLGDITASSGGVVNLNVSSGPFAYAAAATHTHDPFGGGAPLFGVAAGNFVLTNPEGTNTAAANVRWVVEAPAATVNPAKLTINGTSEASDALYPGGVGSPVPNPVHFTFSFPGCSNGELHLAMSAPNIGLPWSYLDSTLQWRPLPSSLDMITPFVPMFSDNGAQQELFNGDLPGGTYDIFLVCDSRNGHLDTQNLATGPSLTGMYIHRKIRVY